ncbi:MAG: hypothetical protein QOG48_1781 [Verrucomicrobiota bacterium]
MRFASAGFQSMHDFVNHLLERHETNGSLFESAGDAVHEFAAIELLMCAVALDHAQIGALDFFVSGEAIFAFQTFASATDGGGIAGLS